MASSTQLRCAVIGLGMGGAHAEGYRATPEARLVAVADINPERLKAWAEKVGGDDHCYSDYKKMLKTEKPDLVSVALPNALHAPVTIDCLKAGAHVLCEKPMAMSVREALAMRAAAGRARRKLGLNLSYRFTPAGRALKDLADDGFLGQAYHACSHWTRRDGFPGFGGWFGQKKLSGGGPMIDLGVHRIDLALWLMGGPDPITVSGGAHALVGVPRAKARGQAYDCEDFAAGFIRLAGGATLTTQISWFAHQEKPEDIVTTVYGTKGSLVHRNVDGGYEFAGEFFHEAKGHKLRGGVLAANPSVPSAYASMVHAVLHNQRPLADAEDGIRVQRILDGLYRSAATGREVRV